MAVRSEVQGFIELGRLPSTEEVVVDGDRLEACGMRLHAIQPPVTDEEAGLLVGTLPLDDDDCFGLAWTLLHLIESAPGWPLDAILSNGEGEWVERMKGRVRRSDAR